MNRSRAAVLASTLLALSAGPAFAQTTHSVTVKRFKPASGAAGTEVSLSNATTDTMFTNNNTRLADNVDGTGPDVTDCQLVRMARQGSVGTFSQSDGDIDGLPAPNNVPTSTEMQNLLTNVNGRIKVVNTISFCGAANQLGTRGCANINGNSEVVIRSAPDDSWLHEFGHTEGLGHVSATGNIMQSGGTNRHVITGQQCANFSKVVDLDGPGGSSATGDAPAGQQQPPAVDSEETDFTNIPIEEVAIRGFDEGIPIGVADYYGEDDVAILKQMLLDPDQARNHDTIAGLIAMISDASDDDAEALEDFISRGRGTDPAMLTATLGLGVLAAKASDAGGASAITFLSNQAKKNSRLGQWAVGALGLSGRVAARAHLETLRSQGRHADRIDAALDENYRMNEVGLRRYYRRGR